MLRSCLRAIDALAKLPNAMQVGAGNRRQRGVWRVLHSAAVALFGRLLAQTLMASNSVGALPLSMPASLELLLGSVPCAWCAPPTGRTRCMCPHSGGSFQAFHGERCDGPGYQGKFFDRRTWLLKSRARPATTDWAYVPALLRPPSRQPDWPSTPALSLRLALLCCCARQDKYLAIKEERRELEGTDAMEVS